MEKNNRFAIIPCVCGIFLREGKVLLLQRANTGYEDGNWGLPSGHVEPGETMTQGVLREVREEVGVILRPQAVEFAHVLHRAPQRIELFFKITEWVEEPRNAEPDKCSRIAWFPLAELPDNTIPHIKNALRYIEARKSFSEFGWDMNG